MLLQDWLEKNHMTPADLAKASNGRITRSAISLITHGRRFPRPGTIKLFLELTKGAVTANDFMDARANA